MLLSDVMQESLAIRYSYSISAPCPIGMQQHIRNIGGATAFSNHRSFLNPGFPAIQHKSLFYILKKMSTLVNSGKVVCQKNDAILIYDDFEKT